MAKGPRETIAALLDTLDKVEEEHGAPIRVYLACAYSIETESAHFDGVVKTEDPAWLSLALLNRAYEAIERRVEEAEEDAGD